jgi:hypothetical protein
MPDLAQAGGPVEWEDIQSELCSTAREACSFGADWLFTDDPATLRSNFERLVQRTHWPPAPPTGTG